MERKIKSGAYASVSEVVRDVVTGTAVLIEGIFYDGRDFETALRKRK